MVLAIPVAMLAGVVSFFSPCVLPLLPGYLSYATGLSAAEVASGGGPKRQLLLGTLGSPPVLCSVPWVTCCG
ncbi:cytochrome c biogenesis protein [Mycobacteroides abscessus subsp. abscessus]|nr:cytochrome c biogenesis protein [Mycobacteroides abscessus subsp. abscessus]